MSGEFEISSVLSCCNKNLKQWMDHHYSPRTDQCHSLWIDQCHSPRVKKCYSSVLQLGFIQKVKENTSWRREGMPNQKARAEERPLVQFGSSLCIFFLLPWGLCSVNWPSQECCLSYLRSSLRHTDLPLFYFPFLLF